MNLKKIIIKVIIWLFEENKKIIYGIFVNQANILSNSKLGTFLKFTFAALSHLHLFRVLCPQYFQSIFITNHS